MFCILMFQDNLEKTIILVLQTPKNVSFHGINWNWSLVISRLKKKLEKMEGKYQERSCKI